MYVLEEMNEAGAWQPVCTNHDAIWYVWQTYTDLQDAIEDFKDFLKDEKYRLAYYEQKAVVNVVKAT